MQSETADFSPPPAVSLLTTARLPSWIITRTGSPELLGFYFLVFLILRFSAVR